MISSELTFVKITTNITPLQPDCEATQVAGYQTSFLGITAQQTIYAITSGQNHDTNANTTHKILNIVASMLK